MKGFAAPELIDEIFENGNVFYTTQFQSGLEHQQPEPCRRLHRLHSVFRKRVINLLSTETLLKEGSGKPIVKKKQILYDFPVSKKQYR